MSVVIREFQDILLALETHPEWREELRRAILSDDFLALPQIVRELAEAQKRTEATVAELAEAQKRTEARLERLEQVVQELIEAQKHTEAKVAELAEAQKRTEARLERLEQVVQELVEAQKQTQFKVANLRISFEGRLLEERCREHPFLFSRLVRRPAIISPNEISALLDDAIQAGTLTEEEAFFLSYADLIVRGYHRREDIPLYLAVEVSVRVDTDDVERAFRRRDLLAQAGYTALPVVVGTSVHPRAREMADAIGVEIIEVEDKYSK